jgi:hypothetical protein
MRLKRYGICQARALGIRDGMERRIGGREVCL